jgi:hypothetical protein
MTSQRDVRRERAPLAESRNDSRGGSIEARTASFSLAGLGEAIQRTMVPRAGVPLAAAFKS